MIKSYQNLIFKLKYIKFKKIIKFYFLNYNYSFLFLHQLKNIV